MPATGLEALVRAAKYSVIPNKLGFCGPKEAARELFDFIENPSQKKVPGIEALLRQFNALFPYLELVSSAKGLEPFDEKVVDAYWLGSSLLENVRLREFQKTVLSLQRFGLPREIAEEKAAGLREGMIPHHSFHVLYINFINPEVKPLVKNLSNCLVQWAELKEEAKGGFVVKGTELFSEGRELKLREKVKKVENPFKIPFEKGALVSVHWGNAIESLSVEQFNALKKYTVKTLNSAL